MDNSEVCAVCTLHTALSVIFLNVADRHAFSLPAPDPLFLNSYGPMSQAHPILILYSSDNMIGIGVGMWPKQGALFCK